jgi:hypothetical protein
MKNALNVIKSTFLIKQKGFVQHVIKGNMNIPKTYAVFVEI